jgi:hypothetical protein
MQSQIYIVPLKLKTYSREHEVFGSITKLPFEERLRLVQEDPGYFTRKREIEYIINDDQSQSKKYYFTYLHGECEMCKDGGICENGGMCEDVICDIEDHDETTYDITIYIPKYNIRRIINRRTNDLEKIGIYRYEDPTIDSKLSAAQFEQMIIKNFGKRAIGKIKKAALCYKVKVNYRTITLSIESLKAFSYDLPGLIYHQTSVPHDVNLVGRYVAMEIVDNAALHSLLLDDRLARILTNKPK